MCVCVRNLACICYCLMPIKTNKQTNRPIFITRQHGRRSNKELVRNT